MRNLHKIELIVLSMYEFKLFAKKICSINFYNYLCSRKRDKGRLAE